MEETPNLYKLSNIELAVFDVDGVFTNGTILMNNQGEEWRQFHLQDGLGIKLLIKMGIKVAIITAKKSEGVNIRMRSLGIEHIYQGYENKILAFNHLLQTLNLLDSQVMYTGDDLPDLPLIKRSGFGIAVRNAINPLKNCADYVTIKKGGEGAVREICDLLLRAKKKDKFIIDSYLE